MELVYSASRPPSGKRDWVRDEVPICCLSPKNIIAFTTTMNLSDNIGSPGSRPSPMETIYHIYVCDMDKSWEVFSVSSYTNNIVALKWDISGTQLLVATAHGACHIYAMKNWLLNDWECVQCSRIEGEEIVAITWLHNGKLMSFNGDRRDSVLYTDKITRSPFSASLTHFGGRAVDGWIAITSTGLVSACYLTGSGLEKGVIHTSDHADHPICVGLVRSGETVTAHMESLAAWRSRILHADITRDSSGDLLVAVSDGALSTAIRCYRVSLKLDKETCVISSAPTASFYIKCHAEGGQMASSARVTHVEFLSSEAGDALIVGAGDAENSHVELWTLTNQAAPLHRMYKPTTGADSSYKLLRWSYKSSIAHTSLPTSIAVPRFPITYSSPDPAGALFQYVAIAYKDGSVKLVNRSNFQPMTSTNLDTGISEPVGGEKRRRLTPYIVHMQQTLTGCGLVGLDQYSCLYVMKAANTRDPVTQVAPAYLVGMFEYCMIAGYDWWDLTAALRPGTVENIIAKLRDNFLKHPATTQEVLLGRHVALRQTLYRCSGLAQRAADTHAHLMLLAISNAFKSTLRPKTLSAQELSPAEKLTNNCTKNFEVDLDKVVLTLNPENKEFIVEPTILQELQPLMQWLGDLTLYLLTALPMCQTYATFPGAALLHDHAFLALLRETLVVIRIWGLINPSCLPHFTCTSNFDCLAQLFKLLTKVWLCCRDANSVDVDENIVDECCLLSSQVIVPPVHQGLFGKMDYSNSILAQQHPVTYVFGEVPQHAKRSVLVALPDGQQMCAQKMDMVRQVSLGMVPSNSTRQCSRCGAYSQHKPPSKSQALRAWELRWVRACLCGGLWRLVSPHKTPAADL